MKINGTIISKVENFYLGSEINTMGKFKMKLAEEFKVVRMYITWLRDWFGTKLYPENITFFK